MGRLVCSDDVLQVTANTTSAELIPQDQVACPESGDLIFCATASATGILARLVVGGEAKVNSQGVHLGTSTIGQLRYPEDLMCKTRVQKGETLSLKFENVTGGNLNVCYKLFVMD